MKKVLLFSDKFMKGRGIIVNACINNLSVTVFKLTNSGRDIFLQKYQCDAASSITVISFLSAGQPVQLDDPAYRPLHQFGIELLTHFSWNLFQIL